MAPAGSGHRGRHLTLALRAHAPPLSPPPVEGDPPPRPTAAARDDSSIWTARLGEPRARPAATPTRAARQPRPTPPRAAPLETRFVLKALLSGSRGSCIVLDRQTKKECILYLGSELPDGLGRLETVQADRVVFRRGDDLRTEILRLPAPRTLALGRGPPDSGCPRTAFVDPAGWSQGTLGLVLVQPPPSAGAIEAGDRLLAIDGRSVRGIQDLDRLARPGTIRLTLVRAGSTIEVVLRIDG